MASIKKLLFPVVDYLADTSYWSARQYFRFWLDRDSEQPVLMYSMGKVGSAAIVYSLQQLDPPLRVMQLHWLHPDNLARDMAFSKRAAKQFAANRGKKFRPSYIWRGEYYADKISAPPAPGQRWKVITLVREPVIRHISGFFQNIESYFGYDYQSALQTRTEEQVCDELLELFYQGYGTNKQIDHPDSDPLTWFDIEMKPTLGIDVYQSAFDPAKGLATYAGPTADLLLIRLESADEVAQAGVREFLQLESFDLLRSNVAEDKPYAGVYRIFKKRARFSASYLDEVYSSRYCQHFYSPTEIQALKEKWSAER